MSEPQSYGDPEHGQLNSVSRNIIGCAIEVHRHLGPGLLEPMYESALCFELHDAGLDYRRQVRVPAYYKGRLLGDYRIDLIVNDLVLVEVKSVAGFTPVFEAQLLTYLRVTGKRLGLLINFNSRIVKEGIKRMIL